MWRDPWERRKPPEYYRAAEFEKLQWACGIPSRHWNTKLSSIHPTAVIHDFKGNVDRIKAIDQAQYLEERVHKPELLNCNRIACFTSIPTDEHALAAACLLASAYIEMARDAGKAVRVRIDDIQDYEKAEKFNKEFYSVAPDIVILYNLNDNSSRQRLSLACDLMKNFEGTYRAVVATSDNSLKFAREKLYLEPQEVYQFEGRPRKISSR